MSIFDEMKAAAKTKALEVETVEVVVTSIRDYAPKDGAKKLILVTPDIDLWIFPEQLNIRPLSFGNGIPATVTLRKKGKYNNVINVVLDLGTKAGDISIAARAGGSFNL